MSRFRYGPWRGGPDPLAPPFDVRTAVDELGRDVLAGAGVREAVRDLLHRGPQGATGLGELAERVRRQRDRVRRRGRLDGVLDAVRELLDRAVAAERQALAGDDSDDARFRQTRLDALPGDPARAVAELADYDWRSPAGRAAYEQIREMLRRDVLDQQFRGLRAALAGGADQQRLKDMLADLNALLAAHARGEDTTDRFNAFMERHGELFPEQPRDVDELVDVLARRAAAAQRLLRSLTPQQRDELARLVADALGDVGLAAEVAQLQDSLRALRPGLPWDRPARFQGEQPLGYDEATGALEELADLDALAEQLAQEHPGATLDDIDVERLERTLGTAAAADLERLRQLERELTAQGWVTRDASGLQLTPKALRRLGETALRLVFARLDARGRGEHEAQGAGASGEPTGAWREWRFGDEQPLDVVRTVQRAVLRTAGSRAPTRAVRLEAADLAVVETERRSAAAVVLAVDLSYSMVQEGRWAPMKQTALALAHLVATRFRQDVLEIVGFDRHARRLTPEQLAGVEPEWVQGTNLHHALLLAERFLQRHPAAEPVVIVVTDGEPTAHLDDAGQAVFAWPPTQETVARTVAQVDRLTRRGATLNLVMLGDDPGLRRFVDAVARRNGGRVLTPGLDDLGAYVVTDYLRARGGPRPARWPPRGARRPAGPPPPART